MSRSKNPFVEEDLTLRPAPAVLVIFGATGDLTRRKLVPALYNLSLDGYLPEEFLIVGVARRPLSDDDLREYLREGVANFSRRGIDEKQWRKFAERIFYQQVRFKEEPDYLALKARLEEFDQRYSQQFTHIHYLATSPDLFGVVTSNLGQHGFVTAPGVGRRTALVIEKPFGTDLASARKLNRELRDSFAEQQLFRIDHYLGKETVQNIMVFRFANGIFESLWNRNYIDSIQISVCEKDGVEDRGDYFDSSGIVRDIVQNHLLQMLALLCIEPPMSISADAIRDEKVKVLRSIRRFTPGMVHADTVRAAYSEGWVDGDQVAAFRQEEGVAKDSNTETYFAARLAIDNWRWSGVPIYIRAGKRLPKRVTEINVLFKSAPGITFPGTGPQRQEQNALSIQVQPRESISLKMLAKPPGPVMRIQPVLMDFSYGDSFGAVSPEAYERLLLDVMKGDATLFTRNDEIEAAWDLLMPIFNTWSSEDAPSLFQYPAGSWGPEEGNDLLRQHNHSWKRL